MSGCLTHYHSDPIRIFVGAGFNRVQSVSEYFYSDAQVPERALPICDYFVALTRNVEASSHQRRPWLTRRFKALQLTGLSLACGSPWLPQLNAGTFADGMHGPDAIAMRRLGVRGPAVLVLHGGPGAPGSARGLARILSQHFTVFEPLQRRSGSLPLTVEQHVQDLAAVAPSPALVVGHSWGAMLGLSFASRYPAAVSKLALVGCGTYDEASRARMRDSIQERLGPERRRRVAGLETQLVGETDPIQREAALQQIGIIHSELETYTPVENGADQSELLPVDPPGHTETWNDVLRLQRVGTEPQAFSQIRAPVLMIHGDYDPHPGAATRDYLRKYVPHLEYLELPRCGHEPWRELHAREAFANALREWLSRPVG